MASAALGHMQFEFLQDLWRHSILEIVSELSEEFLARNHGVALLTLVAKCGESHSRSMSRPRRSRVFTAGTLSPSWRATSSVESCSTSRSITTTRYLGGRPEIPFSTSCRISDLEQHCSGLSCQALACRGRKSRSSPHSPSSKLSTSLRPRKRWNAVFLAILTSQVENFEAPWNPALCLSALTRACCIASS